MSLPESPDLEQVLYDFEHEDVWSRYLTRSERNTARQELLDGIVEILANIHYQHFKTHYGLQREHDPYFADMRRLRMVDNTRKKHGLTVEGSEWTEEARREIQLKRLNQRYPRSLDEIFPPLQPELRTVARAIGLNATEAVWNGGLSKRTKRDGAGYYNRVSVREIQTAQRELLSAPREKLDPYVQFFFNETKSKDEVSRFWLWDSHCENPVVGFEKRLPYSPQDQRSRTDPYLDIPPRSAVG